MASMTVILFLFWVILSGKFDAFHLSLGLLSSAACAAATQSLAGLRPRVSGQHGGTWTRWPGYLAWLIWQIYLSAVAVARVVLDPKMPIDPGIVRFSCRLPNQVAHLTLANSITLTPGTVTVDHEGSDYVIHALTKEAGESLIPAEGEGEMQARVAKVFERRP